MKNLKAFTLIEILIVISVLGLLLTVSSISYSNQLKRARDQKRTANLELIRAQMELFKSQNNGVYPRTLPIYLTAGFQLPSDPQKNTITGVYTYNPVPTTCTTCTNYNLSTPIESVASGTISINPNSIR